MVVELVRRLDDEDRGARTNEVEPTDGEGDAGGESWSTGTLSGIASEDEDEIGEEGEYECHSPAGC